MLNQMRDKVWFMVLVLGIVAAAAGAGLAFVKSKTLPVIEKRILDGSVKPSLDAFFGPLGIENDPIVDRVKLDLGKDSWGRKLFATVFKGTKGGKTVTVALQTEAGGFGGDLSVLTIFDLENQKILGVKTLDQKETKGLGARIADDGEPFIQQFKGMPYGTGVALTSAGGKVDAISGATVSSSGFTVAVDKAVKLLSERADEIRR